MATTLLLFVLVQSQGFNDFAAKYAAKCSVVTGGDFAALHCRKSDGGEPKYIRVGMIGNSFGKLDPKELSKAEAKMRELITVGRWEWEGYIDNGRWLVKEWDEMAGGVWYLRQTLWGSDDCSTYYEKARKLVKTAPDQSVAYSALAQACYAKNK